MCVGYAADMNPYERMMRRLSTTDWFRRVLSRVLTPLDMRLRHSRFAPSRFGMNAPLCFVTVPGKKSGEPRTVPLLYIETRDGYSVAGTNFGREDHPAWVHNFQAAGSGTIEIDGVTQVISIRRLDSRETADLWPSFDSVWPGYRKYREIARRDIRVFLLTPKD